MIGRGPLRWPPVFPAPRRFITVVRDAWADELARATMLRLKGQCGDPSAVFLQRQKNTSGTRFGFGNFPGALEQSLLSLVLVR